MLFVTNDCLAVCYSANTTRQWGDWSTLQFKNIRLMQTVYLLNENRFKHSFLIRYTHSQSDWILHHFHSCFSQACIFLRRFSVRFFSALESTTVDRPLRKSETNVCTKSVPCNQSLFGTSPCQTYSCLNMVSFYRLCLPFISSADFVDLAHGRFVSVYEVWSIRLH